MKMKDMRRALVFFIAFLLVATLPTGLERNDVRTTRASTLSQGLLPIERNWKTNIIVAGYEPSLIDEAILLSGMPTVRIYSTADV
ncbi:MAG: hypothetical protein ACFFE1_11045, partial [Candidatus Thorarchaeota archaeon]